MILFDGKIYESIEQNRLLEELREKIPSILQREPLSPEIIIDAVDQLRMGSQYRHAVRRGHPS